MERNILAERLASQIRSSGIDASDLIRRSDYTSAGEYLIAVAQATAALENPEVRRGLVRAQAEERARQEEAERKAAEEQLRELAKNWRLTPEQQEEIQSAAARQAAEEAAAGRLGGKSVARRQTELVEKMRREEQLRAAGAAEMNDRIRALWREPGEAEREFSDRIVDRPLSTEDAW